MGNGTGVKRTVHVKTPKIWKMLKDGADIAIELDRSNAVLVIAHFHVVEVMT